MATETKQFGKYILLDKVAAGGMAELYRAKLTGAEGFEKLIAIKKILAHLNEEEKLLSSFIDEAKLAAFLHHPNIVQIYDFGCTDDTYFIAMEYLSGKDLRYALKKAGLLNKSFPLEIVLFIISRLCDGLDYAHTLKDLSGKPLNIIHRDIGPQNLFLTYDGQVKIIDFGIAKAAIQSTNTQSGIIKGKVAYMSPEQANGDTIDFRSDIFSVGVILYELLSLVKMYQGDTFQALSKARNADFIPLKEIQSDLPEEIYRILERALAKDVSERYQSAHEMYIDIENFMIENKIRVSQRELSGYMQVLFDEESFTDECRIRDNLKGDASEISADSENATYISEERNIGDIESTVDFNRDEPEKRNRLFLFILSILFLTTASLYVWGEKETYFPYLIKLKTINQLHAKKEISVASFKKLVKEKKYAEAVAECEKAIKKQPEAEKSLAQVYSDALTGVATGFVDTDSTKAAGLLEKANRLNPANFEAVLLLGKLYTTLKQNRKAIEYYTDAADLDRDNPEIFYNLGYNYAVLNDYGKAKEMYSETVKLSPKYTDEALFNLALINNKIGEKKEAISNLKAAIKANPKNTKARKFLKNIASD